jgi:hypothetical protein
MFEKECRNTFIGAALDPKSTVPNGHYRRGTMMKPSTEDQAAGKLHKVKGTIRRRLERPRATPMWKIQAKQRSNLAKFKN